MQRGEFAAPSALVPLLGGCAKRHTQTGFVSLCRGVLGIALLQGANNGHLFFFFGTLRIRAHAARVSGITLPPERKACQGLFF